MKTFPEIPDSPAGRQIAWYLERVSTGVEGSSENELGARCALNMVVRAPFPYPHEVHTGGWKRCNQSYGDFKVASVEQVSDFESKGSRIESRRGLALDWGFVPGAEDEFEALLRAQCGWLANRGLDRLSVFTSEASAGYERVRELASELEGYVVISFGIPEPPGASSRGLYVDPIYF